MAKKVLTALKDILYSIGLLNCGAVLIFMFYGNYMSCEIANDKIIYGIIFCLINELAKYTRIRDKKISKSGSKLSED